MMKTSIIQSWRLRISEGISHERHQEVQNERETGTKICWAFSNSRLQERSGLSIGVTTTIIRCARHVSRILAQELITSSKRADTDGETLYGRRSSVQ
jgi:hypothetical protein